jgi:hypothetical protein
MCGARRLPSRISDLCAHSRTQRDRQHHCAHNARHLALSCVATAPVALSGAVSGATSSLIDPTRSQLIMAFVVTAPPTFSEMSSSCIADVSTPWATSVNAKKRGARDCVLRAMWRACDHMYRVVGITHKLRLAISQNNKHVRTLCVSVQSATRNTCSVCVSERKPARTRVTHAHKHAHIPSINPNKPRSPIGLWLTSMCVNSDCLLAIKALPSSTAPSDWRVQRVSCVSNTKTQHARTLMPHRVTMTRRTVVLHRTATARTHTHTYTHDHNHATTHTHSHTPTRNLTMPTVLPADRTP